MTIYSSTLHNLAQVVKPYDPSTMPIPEASNPTDKIIPIVIGAGIGILIVIVIGILLHRKRR